MKTYRGNSNCLSVSRSDALRGIPTGQPPGISPEGSLGLPANPCVEVHGIIHTVKIAHVPFPKSLGNFLGLDWPFILEFFDAA